MDSSILITFIKYCIVGSSGAILSWVVFYLLTRKLQLRDYIPVKILNKEIQLPWAIAFTTGIVVIWNFTLNYYYTFR